MWSQGTWDLWRDDHQATHPFASYPSATELLRDTVVAAKTSQTRKEAPKGRRQAGAPVWGLEAK